MRVRWMPVDGDENGGNHNGTHGVITRKAEKKGYASLRAGSDRSSLSLPTLAVASY